MAAKTIYDNYVDKHEFIKVTCNCWKPQPLFLGYFQADIKHMSMYYCKNCKCIHTYMVDDEGLVHRNIAIAVKRFINNPKEYAIAI